MLVDTCASGPRTLLSTAPVFLLAGVLACSPGWPIVLLPPHPLLDLHLFLPCFWPSLASYHQLLGIGCSCGDWCLPYLLYKMLGGQETVLCPLNGVVQPGGVWAGPCLRTSNCQEPWPSRLTLEGEGNIKAQLSR